MRKRNSADLACFGGRPLFAAPMAIGQLSAPPADQFITSLRSIYDGRRLSNDGPFLLELEKALGAYHGTAHCVATTNASVGLTMLLQSLTRGVAGEVILPAFGFKGLPHYVCWAGLTPVYCDVEHATHALDPAAVERYRDG